MSLASFPPVPAALGRDSLWQHARNSLSIARLLLQDGRPSALVDTACGTAVEAACRAALCQAGLFYDGDMQRALARLAAPRGLWEPDVIEAGHATLAAAEHALAWIAGYLRSEAPERSWGF